MIKCDNIIYNVINDNYGNIIKVIYVKIFNICLWSVNLDENLNIRYVINVNILGDGRGDACYNDDDGDNVINELDNCPNNSKIYRTDFRYFSIF